MMPRFATAFFITLNPTASSISMPMLHIFNPETDYALAMADAPYTAPKKVREMRDRLTFIPALLASEGDAILSERSPAALAARNRLLGKVAEAKGMTVLFAEDLRSYLSANPETRISPWGWNFNLRSRLMRAGVGEDMLPSIERLRALRRLAHRSTCIPFMEHFDCDTDFLKENADTEERCIERLREDGELCLKAPWSSSGRGILFTRGIDETKIRQWIRGILRDQGSVIIEKEQKRIFDFGSEWTVGEDGSIRFDGYSALVVSDRGQYRHNVIASPEEFIDRIFPAATKGTELSANDLLRIRDRQKEALDELTRDNSNGNGRTYAGRVGIDIFVTADGKINPCVEINFRTTMGMVALKVAEAFASEEDSEANRLIRSIFAKRRLDLSGSDL